MVENVKTQIELMQRYDEAERKRIDGNVNLMLQAITAYMKISGDQGRASAETKGRVDEAIRTLREAISTHHGGNAIAPPKEQTNGNAP